MPTFETLPRSGKDWKDLTPRQRDTFRKVVKDAFVPDLMAGNFSTPARSRCERR